MKALIIKKHKTNLTNILIDIYKDNFLAPILGFKGGTAAMLFYNLPRFSIDLNFDLTMKYKNNSKKIENLINRMTKLLSAKYAIKDQCKKYHTLFWRISYGLGLAQIKIEISTRNIPYNHYKLKSFYGVRLKVLDIKDMIAHKMVAALERTSIANRDLFDIHYFLGTPHANEINYDIIKHRTNKNPKEFYKYLYNFIDEINPKSILAGLGEVLDNSQKDWAKAKLLEELKGLIQRQIDLLNL